MVIIEQNRNGRVLVSRSVVSRLAKDFLDENYTNVNFINCKLESGNLTVLLRKDYPLNMEMLNKMKSDLTEYFKKTIHLDIRRLNFDIF